jgi:hypothetical protein
VGVKTEYFDVVCQRSACGAVVSSGQFHRFSSRPRSRKRRSRKVKTRGPGMTAHGLTFVIEGVSFLSGGNIAR